MFCATGILPVANSEKFNKLDACSTRVSMFCATGILPVANSKKLNLQYDMTKSIKIAKTLLFTYYAYMLEYRAELFLWALSGALPFILMGVWMQAAETVNLG